MTINWMGMLRMSVSRILKWVTGGMEAVLAIPILGATIVIGFLSLSDRRLPPQGMKRAKPNE